MSIVVEERLLELFDKLPPTSDGFKPVYHFGDGIELNQFVKHNDYAVYPLIYQSSLRCNINTDRDEAVLSPLEFFIAVKTETELNNKERWATSYKNVLQPLYINIQRLFEVSGIIRYEQSQVWQQERFPAYSQTEGRTESKTIDIIDAIRVSLNCTIENRCINKYIKF